MALTSIMIRLAVVLLATFLPGVAMAADVNTAEVIAQLYESFKAPIVAFGGATSGGGLMLIQALVILHIAAGGLSYAAGTTDLFDLYVKGVKLSFAAFITAACFIESPAMTSMSGYPTVAKALEGGFRTLQQAAASAAGLTANTTGALVTAIAAASLEPIFRMADLPVVPAGWSLMDMLTNLPGILVGLVMWFFATLAFIIAAAVILAEAVAADLTLHIAIAFAPLMVPWLLFRPMEFLFNAWIKTILVAGVGFIIAMLFCGGLAKFATAASTILSDLQASDGVAGSQLVAIYSPILLGSAILIVLGGKVIGVAHSLLSGGGMDGISLHAFRQAIASTGAGASIAGKSAASIGSAAAKAPGAARAIWNAKNGSTPQSIGGQAADKVAKAQGKVLDPQTRRDATAAGNKAYSAARFAGKSHATAMGEVNRAVNGLMTGVARAPSSRSDTSSSESAATAARQAHDRLKAKAERFKAGK